MGVVIVVFAAVLLVPAIGLVLGGLAVNRRASVRRRDQRYVPVTARVVEHHRWQRPETVLFDYPAPDGTWLRAKRAVGIGALPAGVAGPGTPFTVWVDPGNPADVRFDGAGSAPGLLGAVMVGMGVMVGLFAVGFAVVVLTMRH